MTLRRSLQAELDALPAGATYDLPPGEHAGPVVIRKALTLRGGGATLWSATSPVLTVAADGVTLSDLFLEATGAEPHPCALRVVAVTPALQMVECHGAVEGLPGEEGTWEYPLTLPLGDLPSGAERTIALRLTVPVACQLRSAIDAIRPEPAMLSPGTHDILLRLEPLPADTLLYGSLLLVTAAVTRRILVTACVHAGAAEPAPLPAPARPRLSLAKTPAPAPPLPPPPPAPEPPLPSVPVPPPLASPPARTPGRLLTGRPVSDVFTPPLAPVAPESPLPESPQPETPTAPRRASPFGVDLPPSKPRE